MMPVAPVGAATVRERSYRITEKITTSGAWREGPYSSAAFTGTSVPPRM